MPAAYGAPSQGEIARGREEGAAGPRRGDRPDSVPPMSLRSCAAGSRLTPDGRGRATSDHRRRGGRRRRRAAAHLAAPQGRDHDGRPRSEPLGRGLPAPAPRTRSTSSCSRSPRWTRSTPEEKQPGDGGVLRGRRWPRTSSRRAASGSRRTSWSARSATRRRSRSWAACRPTSASRRSSSCARSTRCRSSTSCSTSTRRRSRW